VDPRLRPRCRVIVTGARGRFVASAANLANQTRLTVEADVEIYRYDLETARRRNSKVPELTAEERQKCLASEPFLEKDGPSIQRAAEQIPSGGSDIETIRAIQDFINRTMRYVRDPKTKGAVGALRDGYGKCVDFADLFVALCRAKKIPARTCEGFVAAPLKQEYIGLHEWAEVFLTDCGWVPFDPTHIAKASRRFEHSDNKYVYCARGMRIDPFVAGWVYGSLATGAQVQVDELFTFISQVPLAWAPSDRTAYRPVAVVDLDKAAQLVAAAKSARLEKAKASSKPRPVINDEAAATRKLTMAKELMENGKVDKARQRLQEIIDRYPSSEAARDARKLLDNANH
jgi:transglutaminase-like putative cysteine protease